VTHSVRTPSRQSREREVYLSDHGAEGFIKTVGDARRESVGTVVMTVKRLPESQKSST
jgi:hypothetical protein